MTLGAANPCRGHSHESSSLRRQQLLWRQQLPWVIVASVHQSTATMLKEEEENAHGRPREGRPLRPKQQKVTHRQPQAAPQVTWRNNTPHSSVTRPQRLSVSDLPPLYGPQLPLVPPCQLSPEMQRAASARVKLPHLPAAAPGAAPGFSPGATARAVGPMARGQPEMVPPSPRGTLAAGGAWEMPSLARRTEGLWRGSAARQGHHLPPVPPAHGLQIRTGTQPAWKHLGHSEIEELIKVKEGLGGNTCSDLFRDLGPYLCENRSVKSTLRTPKWLSARQEAEGIRRPAQQTARHKRLCPEDEEALMQRLRKKREELEDKVHEEMFRAIFSSLDDAESPMRSKCILKDASSLTLEPAAGPWVPHSTCSMIADAAGETQTSSELVSLDQLLAELGPVWDNSLSCNALKDSTGERENNAGIAHPDLLAGLCPVSGDSPSCTFLDELLEMWEEEELQERAVAGESDSEAESPLPLPLQEEEAEPPASPVDSDPCIELHSEPLPTASLEDPKMSVGCPLPADPADEAEEAGKEAAQATPPQEKLCRDEALAGAGPVPAQPLARCVPACPAGSAAVPQPPAPRRWRSMAKTARRALRRLFSFSCLRGQPEE
ncbi:uncharacterized protein LOC128782909 [Vidua chalybeata]|uniref:uncharacterized protein LOC128782909 n=1 Tax=Vidua chalybeata TaxID=81927 RepID=UPI0023A7D08E|nr:uncharacterized protein LOC128782909 [Vidua chalybeata]